VIGFVGGLPRLSQSFHELGYGDLVGTHVIVRASTDLQEAQAFEKALDELPQEERAQLMRSRRRHRAIAVLLHEVAHTLGAIHDTMPHTIMKPAYDWKIDGFGEPTEAVLRASIAHRAADGAPISPATLHDLATAYSVTGSWVSSEREDMLARLERAEPPSATKVTSAPVDPVIASLSDSDRAIYLHAVALHRDGKADEAWKAAQPLFAAHPNVVPIQDLRCKLATERMEWHAAKAECADLVRLSR
jgi:hypothetical protein